MSTTALPQELIDEIIGSFTADDKQSLRNCSLVAKSWRTLSQRRLFESIEIGVQRGAALQPWMNKFSPGDGILQHVRSLFVANVSPFQRSRSQVIDPFLRIHLPSFPQLRRLTFSHENLQLIVQLGALASRHTIKYLCLTRCHTTITTLVTLINSFPNLLHLQLLDLSSEAVNEPIPPLSRPLQTLSVNEPNTLDDPGILDQLMALQPQCEGVTISISTFVAPSLTQRVINGVEETVKRLNLRLSLECGSHALKILLWSLNETPYFISDLDEPLTLINCRELCELEVYCEDMEPELVSTITSLHIQKITFFQSRLFTEHTLARIQRKYWAQLDGSLCRLIDRPGYELRLVVEFRFPGVRRWAGGPLLKEHLPEIHEKGVVRIVDAENDMAVYCSDMTR